MVAVQGDSMKNNVLIPLSDSKSSNAVLDYVLNMAVCPEEFHVTLLHVFRKPSGGEDLMGKKYMQMEPEKYEKILENARNKLIEKGLIPENISILFSKETYPTIADGIIDQANKLKPSMVVIGRKRMSKAEEFVLGDVSIKLVRALEGMAILVVKVI
jgi:nucleotide-binding universal stress UspA family protein